MNKYTRKDLNLGPHERPVHPYQNPSIICLKFRTLIDANTQVAELLNEAKSEKNKEGSDPFSTQQTKYVLPTQVCQAPEDAQIKIKKLKSNSEDEKGSKYICAKLVLEKLLEDCRVKNTKLASSVSHYIEDGMTSVISQFKNSQNFRKTTMEMATLIEIILTSDYLSVQDISKMMINFKIEELPLFSIWKFSTLQVVSFEKVLDKIKGNPKISRLLEDALGIIFSDPENCEDGRRILKSFISTLIIISYGIPHEDYSRLQECSNKLLTELPQNFLDCIEKYSSEEISDISQSSTKNAFINIYETMISVSTVDASSLEQFFTNQLITLLTYKPEVPVSQVIKEQEKWRSTRMNKAISKLMFSIIVGMGHILAFNTLDSVVSSLEVNWSLILTFLSTLLLSHPESATKLRGVIDCYIRKGCSTFELEFLILGFLFARHASQEGRHIFPSYSQWFGAAFGSENSSPANCKKSFLFLFQFLTTLVPFESPTSLRAHIHQSIYVPKGCQKILRDYQHLARAQIQYLTNKPDPVFDSNGVIDLEPDNKSKALEEIRNAIDLFEKLGKVPSFVIEASIFKRPYFLNSFLPLLLKPRVLPSNTDSKCQLIEELTQLDKIPKKIYNLYMEQCKEMASLSHTGKNEIGEPSSKPLTTLKDLLEQFIGCLFNNSCTSGNAVDNVILNLLSQISNHLEDLTKLFDLKFTNVSIFIVSEKDYNSSCLLFQVIELILEYSQKIILYSESKSIAETSKFSNCLLQLLSMISVSPALQHSLMATLFYQLKSFEIEFSEKNLGFYGHLLSELKKIEGMFHYAKISGRDCEQSVKFVDLIVSNLPKSTPKCCLLSCFILSATLEQSQPEVRHSNDYKDMLSVYACLASRLITMETEWHLMNITLTSFKRSGNQVIFPINKIPRCCKLFVEGEPPMHHVQLKDWLSFELKAPWGDTPLSKKIRHLQYWFNVLICKTDKGPENYRRKFLVIFWSLMEEDSHAINTSEMLILLQNLLSCGSCCNLSLIEEWKNWKKSNFNQGDGKPINATYHSKLIEFMSLCRCLPSDKFFNKENFLLSSSHLKELILDILEGEGTLYLSFCDALYFFEALIETVKTSSFPAAQIQQGFLPIKDSLLFYWKSLKFATTVSFESVLDRLLTLKYLNNFDFDEPQAWKSLPSNDYSTLILASLLNDDDDHIESKINCLDSVDSNAYVLTLWKCVSFLGNDKLKCKESLWFPASVASFDKSGNSDENVIIISEDEEDDCDNKFSPVKKNLENKKILTACLCLLERNYFTHPDKLLSTFKTECGQVPLAWKSTLVGLVFILLTKLQEIKLEIQNYKKVAYVFSFLLCTFNSFVKLIETDESAYTNDSGLSYISQLNQKVTSCANNLPKCVIPLIPVGIVNQSDSHIKNIINCSKS